MVSPCKPTTKSSTASRPFVTGGAFPVYNTDFNFSSNQPTKFPSYDKYLFGGQVGIDVEAIKDWRFKFAAAYYYFHNIEGKLSDPYTPQNANDASNTDNSRPSFAQKGNTYFPIRNIVPDASNQYGAINQWQYYGLGHSVRRSSRSPADRLQRFRTCPGLDHRRVRAEPSVRPGGDERDRGE